jgi:hypothetical protein
VHSPAGQISTLRCMHNPTHGFVKQIMHPSIKFTYECASFAPGFSSQYLYVRDLINSINMLGFAAEWMNVQKHSLFMTIIMRWAQRSLACASWHWHSLGHKARYGPPWRRNLPVLGNFHSTGRCCWKGDALMTLATGKTKGQDIHTQRISSSWNPSPATQRHHRTAESHRSGPPPIRFVSVSSRAHGVAAASA